MDYNPYELIYMSRTGDQFAVQALFDFYGPYLGTLVNSALSSYPALRTYYDDIKQEAMISLFDAVETYREDMNTSFKSFLSLVARRRIRNVIRSYMPAYRNGLCSNISLDSMVNEEETYYDVIPQRNMLNEPDYYTAYNDAADRLRQCVASFNETEYEVYRSIYRGDTYASAAERLNCTPKSYDGKVQRVKKKLTQAAGIEKKKRLSSKVAVSAKSRD